VKSCFGIDFDITSTLEREEIVRHILDQAQRMVPYETASVMELDGSCHSQRQAIREENDTHGHAAGE